MFEWMPDLHWFRPWFLLGILLAPPVFFLVRYQRVTKNISWQKHIDPALLQALLIPGQAVASRNSASLPMLASLMWVLACIAMAGPSWQQSERPVYQQEDALVIVLDLSPSMLAEDVQPSRYVAAQRKITDLLRKRKTGLASLLVYAGDAHVVAPLTDDNNTLLNLVGSLSPDIMPVAGSHVEAAFSRALELLSQAGYERGEILLITDGIASSALATLQDLLDDKAVKLSIIAVGTEEAAPVSLPDGQFLRDSKGTIIMPRLDVHALQKTANILGASFSTLRLDDKDIAHFLQVSSINAEIEKNEHEKSSQALDGGFWLLPALLILFLLLYRKGVICVLPFALLLMPPDASALDWDALWYNREQRAAKALEQGEFDTVRELSKNQEVLGASEYTQGNYETALEHFSRSADDDDGFYNRANTLAQLGQFEEAIQAYDRALALNPQHEDAIANRQLVSDLLEKQKKQESSQQQQGQNQQKENRQQQEKQQRDAGQQSSEDSGQNEKTENASGKNDAAKDDRSSSDDKASDNGEDQQAAQQQRDKSAAENSEEASDASSSSSSQQDNEKTSERKASRDEAEDQPAAADKPAIEQTTEDTPLENTEAEAVAQGLGQSSMDSEQRQLFEQRLRQVPDDPSALLRNKFDYYYRLNQQLRQNNAGPFIDQEGNDERW